MCIKVKRVSILVVLICILLASYNYANSYTDAANLKLVYISDLNLFPTPSVSQREKHIAEKQYGLLLFESQAIFQEIIRYINQKFDSDFVVFGGNNISGFSGSLINGASENVWHLFLDMVSEIKSDVLLVPGKNEKQTQKKDELTRVLSSFGPSVEQTWWSYKIKKYLLLSLDSDLMFENNHASVNQLKWLKKILEENKKTLTLIFMHRALIDPEGEIIKSDSVENYFKILKEYPQVVLTVSGDKYLNRIKLINKSIYLISPSPIAFPCSFKFIELTPTSLKISTLRIPLGGIVKKAEKYLIESDTARSLFPESPLLIKKYVLGDSSDSNFQISYSDLRNR
ncbi:MAG: hypothetical protein HY094_01040 [Candidatus Melainabacteria bacterium]|nr:hypothetical protein [Candidatus Melainabacteria bacterium]